MMPFKKPAPSESQGLKRLQTAIQEFDKAGADFGRAIDVEECAHENGSNGICSDCGEPRIFVDGKWIIDFQRKTR